MSLVPIISQTWDTTSYVNPTRMNTIENNIAITATAEGTEYSDGVSVKDKIDGLNDKTFAEMSSIGITDANDLPNGIFYNTVVNIANLPGANRFLIISAQVLDTPVRKLQWAFALDGSAYQRLKQGDTWTNWQLKIVAN